ncbi:hypothetical protein EDF81_0215 [Enterobacter sp. BIGb0383]|nr:hypothetical protein EDF81_0215 [Enterobacter sp. BIGb0383]ROS11902.1 hypothetical protein EC848_0215 [Enterobacter sp. BIGb0359]
MHPFNTRTLCLLTLNEISDHLLMRCNTKG